METLFIPLFISAVGYILNEFIGSPLNDFDPNRVFSRYSIIVSKMIAKMRGLDLTSIECLPNKDEIIVGLVKQNLGYYKLLLCGFCFTSWTVIISSIFLTSNLLTLLSYIGIGLLSNILIFKK
jgi:hypothetical protein